MFRLSHITAIGLLLMGLSANLTAETVEMPASPTEEPTESTAESTEFSVQLPGRGMTMEAVENRFGQPVDKYASVGEPPITKWVYKDFTVYFESEFVIHAVVNN